MARGFAVVTSTESGHLGVVELVDVCADLQRRNELLFERLGRWVPTTVTPAAQQLFAEACHLHAWHAELWSQRLPAIGRAPDVALDDGADDPADPVERLCAYRARVTELATLHGAIRSRVDARLDPATVRVLDLVDADVAMLIDRLDAIL